jgi:hypothetical protein
MDNGKVEFAVLQKKDIFHLRMSRLLTPQKLPQEVSGLARIFIFSNSLIFILLLTKLNNAQQNEPIDFKIEISLSSHC